MGFWVCEVSGRRVFGDFEFGVCPALFWSVVGQPRGLPLRIPRCARNDMEVRRMTEGGVRNDMGWRNGGNHGWLSVYVNPLRLATLARVPLLLRKKGRERASFWLQKEGGV